MPKLETLGALPKSTSGRRTTPLDVAFAKALVDAFKKTPIVEDRPATYGSSDRFATRGKASSDGRRYADHVKSELKIEKVSVSVDEHGPTDFGWKLYIPLSATPQAAATPAADAA